MNPSATKTYWLAGYALAAQSSFPRSRLETEAYGRLLAALEPGDWQRLPTPASTLNVSAQRAAAGDLTLLSSLDEALAERPEGVDVCFLDLRPPVFAGVIGPVYPRSFFRIAEHLSGSIQTGGLGDSHILVIVSELKSRTEFQWRRFAELARTDRLTILDPAGHLWSSRFGAIAKAELAEIFAPSVEDVQNRLETKMIRRYGVFPRLGPDGEEDGFTRHYFDGRYCHGELRALFKAQLVEDLPEGESNVVVYDDTPGGWLDPPLRQAISDLKAGRPEEERAPLLSRDEMRDDSKVSIGMTARYVAAVVPVFDRGLTLRSLIEEVRKWAPAAKIAPIAVIGTGSSRQEVPVPNRGRVEVKCLMRGEQQTVSIDSLAPDMTYYRSSTSGVERFLPFTSGEFWELATRAGFTQERNPPPGRHVLRLVPDLKAFMEQNAAWVANKVEMAIQALGKSSVTEVTIAMVAEEEGAEVLSDVLAETLGNTPLGIPRKALTEWREARGGPRDLVDRWRKEEAPWLLEADGILSRDLIVLDEFSYSGKTVGDMTGLLEAANFTVKLVLTIANFSRRGLENSIGNRKVFSFYETEWRGPDAVARMEIA